MWEKNKCKKNLGDRIFKIIAQGDIYTSTETGRYSFFLLLFLSFLLGSFTSQVGLQHLPSCYKHVNSIYPYYKQP